MITTVTLNTSIDKAYTLKETLHRGKVMRVAEVRNTAGGKGLNVTRIIALCGKEVIATGFIGGFNGQYLESLLAEEKIRSQFTWVNGETRSCINILDKDVVSTEFLEPGFCVTPQEKEQFIQNFQQLLETTDVVTISGSLPKGIESDFYAQLIHLAKEAGKKVLVDSSGESFRKALQAKPNLVKPNQEELEALFGVEISSLSETIIYAQKLADFGIEYVVVSLGGDGAILIHEGQVYHGRPPKIQPVNTVGCGDSMVGALAMALEKGDGAVDSLRYAIAIGTANALSPFTGNIDPKIVDSLYEQVSITTLTE